MELFGNTLCVSFSELLSNKLINRSNYDKKVNNGKLNVIRQGKGKGNYALIDYNSLPDDWKEKLQPEKARLERMKEEKYISDTIKFDGAAIKFFKEYIPKISESNQLEYILNAQVLNEMIRIEKVRTAAQARCVGCRKKEIWSSVYKTCEKLRIISHHTLPVSELRLKEKFRQYKKDGYKVLVSGKYGNKSARIINQIEGKLLLKLKRSKFPCYTDMQIFDEYNRQAVLRGMKTIKSPQTVVNYLNDPKIMVFWYSSVYGEREFKEKFLPKFDTKLPELPNALWYSDGTKLNLYYKAYDETRKKMVVRSTDVYEVMDAASEMFLGYHIGDGENFYTQYQAYRNAITKWHVKPYEIVTDNQGGHKKLASQGFFKKICHLHKTTMPHNGQSKTIENAFGRFQMQVLHKLYNFTGQNITAKKLNSRANIDLITKNIDMLPTLDEMKEQYAKCREEWNNMLCPLSECGMTRLEQYTSINNPKAHEVDDYEASEIFMLFSQQPVQYTAQGYIFQLNNQEYRYMIYDSENNVDMTFHLQSIGKRFFYRYDPENMTRIELWEKTTSGVKYVGIATPKVRIHRATQERTEEDNKHLFEQLEANKRAKAAMYIANEDLAIEYGMTEAYTKLTLPTPVGINKDDMNRYREEMKSGTLKSPVAIPEKVEIPEPALFDVDKVGFVSPGDFTKQTSNITDFDIDCLDKI